MALPLLAGRCQPAVPGALFSTTIGLGFVPAEGLADIGDWLTEGRVVPKGVLAEVALGRVIAARDLFCVFAICELAATKHTKTKRATTVTAGRRRVNSRSALISSSSNHTKGIG
jgi:hypothetical protein